MFGTTILDSELMSQNNEPKMISQCLTNSEYTLINFWATWCGPCIVELKDLEELFNNTNRTKLSIMSIHCDEGRDEWLKYIEKYNMVWDNLIIKEDCRTFFTKYNFSAIPFLLLVDKNGVVLEVNISKYCLSELIVKYNLQ